MITTANEMGSIRPSINLRKKTQLLTTVQRRRKKIRKMIHKECLATRVSTDGLIFASGSPPHRFNAVQKLLIKIKKLSRTLDQTLRRIEHANESRRFAFYIFS